MKALERLTPSLEDYCKKSVKSQKDWVNSGKLVLEITSTTFKYGKNEYKSLNKEQFKKFIGKSNSIKIVADKFAPHVKVMEALDEARSLGVSNVIFATK